jgi:hypothetical protein
MSLNQGQRQNPCIFSNKYPPDILTFFTTVMYSVIHSCTHSFIRHGTLTYMLPCAMRKAAQVSNGTEQDLGHAGRILKWARSELPRWLPSYLFSFITASQNYLEQINTKYFQAIEVFSSFTTYLPLRWLLFTLICSGFTRCLLCHALWPHWMNCLLRYFWKVVHRLNSDTF